MAAFTGVLWFVTNKAVKLARAEFIANQRPILRVRNIVVHPPHRNIVPQPSIFQHGELVTGQLYVSNIGGTPATLVEHYVMVRWSQDELPMERPYEGDDGTLFSKYPRIEAGGSYPIPFQSKNTIESGEIATFIRNGQNAWKLWVMGWVDYMDNSNVRHRTAFCRRYNLSNGRINQAEDYDYEHEE